MRKPTSLIFLFVSLLILNSCSPTKNMGMSNMVATMQVDEPIPGVCNNDRVLAILPFPGNGQIKAVAPMTDKEIQVQLNSSVDFLKSNPNYNGKGMVGLIINCKNEMVRCQIDNKTVSPELDEQIIAVFSKLKQWKSGSINGEAIDTSVLYSFTIDDGKISL